MPEDVEIGERRNLGLATVMARKGVSAAALGTRLGVDLADGASASGEGPLLLVPTGPGVWLAVAEAAPAGWARKLAGDLTGLASVSDQSSGYRVLRFRGAGAGALLQKGVFIDLHADAFPVGAAAVTAIARVGVVLWKVDETPSFDVAVFRSYADSFRHWILSVAGPGARLP